MKTFVGFDFYTSHTRVSDDLCLPTIIEVSVMLLISLEMHIVCIVLWD